MLKTIALQTPPGESLTNITQAIREAVGETGVREGVCVVFVPHTTAAVTINSGIDPKTAADILGDIRRLVPTRVDFQHTYDTPADAAGHIKATLVGNSQALVVTQGKLALGASQSVFLYEFDGPRSREVLIRVLADE